MNRLRTSESTANLTAAAMEAAFEDGVLDGGDVNQLSEAAIKSRKAGLRRGKWTIEEENYANRLIREFKLGLLPLTDGTTLRTFLSKLVIPLYLIPLSTH